MPAGSFNGCEQRGVVWNNIRGLARRAGFAVFNNSLHFINLVECSLCGPLTLIKWCCVISSKGTEAASRVAEIHRSENTCRPQMQMPRRFAGRANLFRN